MLMSLQCPPSMVVRLGNIYIDRGRPNWSEQFEHVAVNHPANDICVAYCGNPVIASDLKKQCVRYSSIDSKMFFRLHKVWTRMFSSNFCILTRLTGDFLIIPVLQQISVTFCIYSIFSLC
jgi:hypothetical protein